MALDKPGDQEDEYFLKMEAQRLKKLRAEKDKDREESKSECTHDHYMKCPKCPGELEEVELGGVMIDKCKQCSGIWLDAGELDILTEGGAGSGFLGKLFGK